MGTDRDRVDVLVHVGVFECAHDRVHRMCVNLSRDSICGEVQSVHRLFERYVFAHVNVLSHVHVVAPKCVHVHVRVMRHFCAVVD